MFLCAVINYNIQWSILDANCAFIFWRRKKKIFRTFSFTTNGVICFCFSDIYRRRSVRFSLQPHIRTVTHTHQRLHTDEPQDTDVRRWMGLVCKRARTEILNDSSGYLTVENNKKKRRKKSWKKENFYFFFERT